MKQRFTFSTGEHIEADLDGLYVLLEEKKQYLQNYYEVFVALDDDDYIARGNGFCDRKYSDDFIEGQIAKYTQQVSEIKRWIDDMEMGRLLQVLDSGQHSCVVKSHDETRTFSRKGVADLAELYRTEPTFLKDALVADKVVGKGAAAILILGGVKRIHARLISKAALELLKGHPVQVDFDEKVHHIINRTGTDWCPIEKRMKGVPNAEECWVRIEDFLAHPGE